MALEIELVKPPDGCLGTIRGHGPRLHVAPQHVENLEVEKFRSVQGDTRIEQTLADPCPGPRAENQLDDH